MTPESQRIAIAEACGKGKHLWSKSPGDVPCIGFIPQCDECMIRTDETGANDLCPVAEIPDYLNDLNAMHEAEKVLSEDQAGLFNILLFDSKDASQLDGSVNDYVWHADASRRAEVFLVTLGLWKD